MLSLRSSLLDTGPLVVGWLIKSQVSDKVGGIAGLSALRYRWPHMVAVYVIESSVSPSKGKACGKGMLLERAWPRMGTTDQSICTHHFVFELNRDYQDLVSK